MRRRDDWEGRAAKRMVAMFAAEKAVALMKEAEEVGGPTCSNRHWKFKTARTLLLHGAEQLRISEDIRS